MTPFLVTITAHTKALADALHCPGCQEERQTPAPVSAPESCSDLTGQAKPGSRGAFESTDRHRAGKSPCPSRQVKQVWRHPPWITRATHKRWRKRAEAAPVLSVASLH